MQRNLLSSADVARMANVSPSAVSNWRARANKHFPEPAEMNKGRALFDYDEVANWLQANGIEFKDQRADQAAWTFLDQWRGDLEHATALPMMLWAMCLRKAVAASSSRTRERTWRALVDPETREGHRGLAATLVNAITAHRGPSEPLQVALRFPAGTGRDDDGDADNADDNGDGSGLPEELTDAMLAELIRFVDGIAPESYASIADFMLERTIGLAWRASVDHGTTDSRSSRLLADLAHGFLARAWEGRETNLWGDPTGEDDIAVCDPSCGIAQDLLNFAKGGVNLPGRSGGDGGGHGGKAAGRRIHLYANDNDSGSLAMAARRLYLHGYAYPGSGVESEAITFAMDMADVDLVEHDPFPGVRMDVIMAEPVLGERRFLNPVDPRWVHGRTASAVDSALAWMEDAVAHLSATGRAFIITHTPPMFGAGADQDIRKALLASGCVDVVVALPSGLLPGTDAHPYLWVLSAPDRTRESVLMVDASEKAPGLRGVNHEPAWMADPLRLLAAQAQGRAGGSRLASVDVFPIGASTSDGVIAARWIRSLDILGSPDVSLRPEDWMDSAGRDADSIMRDFTRNGRELMGTRSASDAALSLLRKYGEEGFTFRPVPVLMLGDMAMVSRGAFPDRRRPGIAAMPDESDDDVIRRYAIPCRELHIEDRPTFAQIIGVDSDKDGTETVRRMADGTDDDAGSEAHASKGNEPDVMLRAVTQRSRNAVTRPGDIVLSSYEGLHVAVDMKGGHRVERAVSVIRVDVRRWDPEYVVLMLRGEWNQTPAKMSAGTWGGVKPESMEVPAIPIDQQRRVVAYAHAVEALERQSSLYRAQLDTLAKAARYGVSVRVGNAKEGVDDDAR